MKIELEYVNYMPKELKFGVLYVSKEYKTAAHLCACGCGSKIRTPLTPTEWSLKDTGRGPSLHPSIGNWQLACKSHYWICHGDIRWSNSWTQERIAEGRRVEVKRRETYYSSRDRQGNSSNHSLWDWLKNIFK